MGCTISTEVQRNESADAFDEENEDRLPREFDPQVMSKLLHDAIEARNEELVIKIFYKYSDDSYRILNRVFPNKYSIDMITLSSQNLSCNVSEFVRLRLEDHNLSVCNFLHHHLHEKPENYRQKVVGVICGFQEFNFKNVSSEYHRIYHIRLEDHLRQCFKAELLEVLQHICLTKSKETETEDECAESLHESTKTDDLINGKQEFFRQLKRYSLPFMRTVLELYIQKYQRDIIVEIEKCCEPGELRDLYSLVANVIRHSQLYYARLINELLKSPDDDQNEKYYYLMFFTMTRSQETLRELKKAYRTYCFETLGDEIRELVEDPIVSTLLLKTVQRVSSN